VNVLPRVARVNADAPLSMHASTTDAKARIILLLL
jgi:hypothetical protein